jgi:hypothetical protein
MQAIRVILSSANEALIPIALAMFVGYFGVRGMLGSLPAFLALVLVLSGLSACVVVARSQSSGDDYGQSQPWIDKAIWYSVLFLFGLCSFVYLGTIS